MITDCKLLPWGLGTPSLCRKDQCMLTRATLQQTVGGVEKVRANITKSTLFHYYRKLFPRFVNWLRKELEGCESVLDLGCGRDSSLKFCSVVYSVGVDMFEPYLLESKKKKIHTEYILGDMKKLEFPPKSFDCIMLIEVVEHLTKGEGYQLLEKAERIARKKIIITTPNGFIPHHHLDGNIYQEHISGWTTSEFKELGFKVRGLHEFKGMSLPKIGILGPFLRDSIQTITYHFPTLAKGLFAVKNIK